MGERKVSMLATSSKLAVSAAMSLFGFQSGVALATVVGMLIKTPVMLSVVSLVNTKRVCHEDARAIQRAAS